METVPADRSTGQRRSTHDPMPYRLHELGPTALLMPVIYAIRDTEHAPAIYVGVRWQPPAMADDSFRRLFMSLRVHGGDTRSADAVAEALRDRHRAVAGDEDAAMILPGFLSSGLRITVTLDVLDADGFPLLTGEIAAWLKDGEPYRGNDPEADHAEPAWLDFAFA